MVTRIDPVPAAGPPLDEVVYLRLRDLIVAGDLGPGELFSMNELATQLHVSRTPVALAAARLTEQGMTRIEPRRGIRVLETSVHDLAQIYELRLLLEPYATGRAATLMRRPDHRRLRSALDRLRAAGGDQAGTREFLRRDAAFHDVILQASGNARLAGFVATLRDLQMIRGASTLRRTRPAQQVVADHERIFQLVVTGDADAARAEMTRHIEVTRRLLITQENEPGEPGS